MLTEEEARTKWCPFALVIKCNNKGELVVGNRNSEGSPLGNCLASECVKWRRIEVPDLEKSNIETSVIPIAGVKCIGGYCCRT